MSMASMCQAYALHAVLRKGFKLWLHALVYFQWKHTHQDIIPQSEDKYTREGERERGLNTIGEGKKRGRDRERECAHWKTSPCDNNESVCVNSFSHETVPCLNDRPLLTFQWLQYTVYGYWVVMGLAMNSVKNVNSVPDVGQLTWICFVVREVK